MPLRETEAIVLRTYRLGEADKIVSLFARQMGRLRGVAQGARRPKSRFGAALEPLSYVRLWIFERENRDLLRLNSAELMESFFAMQQDYRVQVAAQYVAEVAERFLPEREVNERVFRLLLAVLRAFRATGQVSRPLLYFDYWMLRLGGFLPDLDRCAACGRELGDESGYYGQGSEGLLCQLCRTAATPRSVSAVGLGFAATARQSTLERWMEPKEVPPGCREAQRFLEEVIQAHVERPLATRSLLDERNAE
jgi:DNA repair protein RecO (recombination protein O)